jgi:protein-L-isoaspartate(D-aspartate) O-methyltransferase
MVDFALARRTMVDCQLRTFDVNDIPLLDAMGAVARERFVPAGREEFAYIDQDLPLTDAPVRRLMLSPMVQARLIQALEIEPGMKVLDVACGFGYSTAVLAELGASVIALEADDRLTSAAGERLSAVGAGRAKVVTGPLEQGHPGEAPYRAILVNGAIEVRPETLLRQLDEQGRLVCVFGRGRAARATLYVRAGDAFGMRNLFDAAAPTLPAFQAEPGFVF